MMNGAKAVLSWLLSKLWQRREVIADAVVEHFDGSLDERPVPRTYEDVRHVQKQIESATSHRVEPAVERSCTRPPSGWTCSRQSGHDGPCAATAVLGSPRQISSKPRAPKPPSLRVVEGARPSSAPAAPPLKPPTRIPRPAWLPGKPKDSA